MYCLHVYVVQPHPGSNRPTARFYRVLVIGKRLHTHYPKVAVQKCLKHLVYCSEIEIIFLPGAFLWDSVKIALVFRSRTNKLSCDQLETPAIAPKSDTFAAAILVTHRAAQTNIYI